MSVIEFERPCSRCFKPTPRALLLAPFLLPYKPTAEFLYSSGTDRCNLGALANKLLQGKNTRSDRSLAPTGRDRTQLPTGPSGVKVRQIGRMFLAA